MSTSQKIQHPSEKHPYITTLSGEKVGAPDTFQVEQVHFRDIAAALSKICRFNGHLSSFYSVAEHSVLVSNIALNLGDFEAVIPALLHDAHEAYCGDLPTPQKDMIAGAREFEQGFERVVREAFGLPAPGHEIWGRVRLYDTWMLHREVRTFRPELPEWYMRQMDDACGAEMSNTRPEGLDPSDAERYLHRRLEYHRWGRFGYNVDFSLPAYGL